MSGTIDMLDDRYDDRLTVCERTLQNYGSSASLYANLPQCASDMLDLGHGDTIAIEVYPDRVTIRPGGDDDD